MGFKLEHLIHTPPTQVPPQLNCQKQTWKMCAFQKMNSDNRSSKKNQENQQQQVCPFQQELCFLGSISPSHISTRGTILSQKQRNKPCPGGGNSNICYFHPDLRGWWCNLTVVYLFKWVSNPPNLMTMLGHESLPSSKGTLERLKASEASVDGWGLQLLVSNVLTKKKLQLSVEFLDFQVRCDISRICIVFFGRSLE